MPVHLTETAIKSALRKSTEANQRRDLADAALPGLRVRLTPTGGATWVLACRDQHGRMRRFPLGIWPDLGISRAREAARTMRVRVRQGADPVAERRQKRVMGKDARAGLGTLSALLDYYGEKIGKARKSWSQSRRRVELVFKSYLALSLPSITRMDLQAVADGYPYPKQAAGALASLRPVLKWAASRGYLAREVTELQVTGVKTRRHRVLSGEELAKLLPTIRRPGRSYGQAVRFMLLTLARREEVCGARWRDVDLDTGTWRIEAERSKNKVEHRIPLPLQALDLLTSIGVGAPSELIFATRKHGRLTNWDRGTKQIMHASGTSGWTRHDLRRTGATMLGEMGELPDIIEAALNHVSIRSPLAATYNRSRYRPQVAAALQRLADALDGIESGAPKVGALRVGV